MVSSRRPFRRSKLAAYRMASCLLVLGCGLGFAPVAADAGIPILSDVPTLAPVVDKVVLGVVNIAVSGSVEVQNPLMSDPFFRQFFRLPNQPMRRQVQAAGSGVIVDADKGYVLTNNHFVAGGEGQAIQDQVIEVTLKDKRHFKAKLVGRDPETDIAVLKIDADRLTAVEFADSDRIRVGDYALAIGNPFGLGQTVTSGIVSALGRSGLGIEGYEDFIQTDASINPGNSGGPLVDLRGNLVGINTAILAPGGGNIGIGFAVPINMARRAMDQLIRYGEVKRGRIGIAIQDLTPDLAQAMNTTRTNGAVIAKVEPGSSADHAGLKTGDLVISADGVAVHSGTQLRNAIGLTRIGDEVKLTVDRGGSERAVQVRVELAQQAANKKPGPER